MTHDRFHVSRGRLDALTDGLFAIAMTILVLELKAPDLPAGAGLPAFQQALFRQWPSLAGYAASFLLLGLFWFQHHWVTHALRRVDTLFFVVNLVFLLLAGSFPFTLSLVLRLRLAAGGGVALVPYFTCLGALMLCLAAMAWLAVRRDLVEPHAPVQDLRRRSLGWAVAGTFLVLIAALNRAIPQIAAYLWVPFLAWVGLRRRLAARRADAAA